MPRAMRPRGVGWAEVASRSHRGTSADAPASLWWVRSWGWMPPRAKRSGLDWRLVASLCSGNWRSRRADCPGGEADDGYPDSDRRSDRRSEEGCLSSRGEPVGAAMNESDVGAVGVWPAVVGGAG